MRARSSTENGLENLSFSLGVNSIICSYIHSLNWNMRIACFEMSPLKVSGLLSSEAWILVLLSSGLSAWAVNSGLLLSMSMQTSRDNCICVFFFV